MAAARIGRLGTVGPGGTPHLVPVCFVLVGDTVWSAVDGKPKSTIALRRLDNVRGHPRASLLVDHYDDGDWSALWWARLDGTARVVEGGGEWEAAVAALVAKYPQYRAAPPSGPAVALAVERWRSWEAAGPRP